VLERLGTKPRETAARRWILVAAQCTAEDLASLLGPKATRAHVVLDADRWLTSLFNVNSYPAVVTIGADGNIAGRWSGDNDASVAAAVAGFE
jgi:hypothetical protein